jgi:type IV pilus assembly protein PilF
MTRFGGIGGCIAALSLALAACTTSDSNPQKADLKEAARLNAQLGIDYMRKGNFEVALEKLQKALDQDDELGVAHSAIALVYQRRGETKLAGKHYREALDLNADDPGTLNNFGIFLCGQGEFEDAEEVFLKAAKNKDNSQQADAWANAGACAPRDDKGRVRAEGYLREALRLNPRHASALASLARVSYEKKDFLKARAFLQRHEINARPTAETLWIGAQTERALGDMTAARAYERRLRNDFPDSREVEMLEKASRPGKR